MITAHAVFRFIYNAVYTLFYILLVGLVVVTPADVVYRAWENGQEWNIWIVVAAYLVTLLVVAFVYATRLYINKTALAAIPKQWIPIDKGDVRPTVYRLIKHGLDRSAAIALAARPSIKTLRASEAAAPDREKQEAGAGASPKRRGSRRLFSQRPAAAEDDDGDAAVVLLPEHRRPPWGDIEHPGWGSPASPDLADLQYSTVFLELPALIEAKVLTFAPPADESDPHAPEPEAMALLQRPASMGLRDYMAHLSALGILAPAPTAAEFLASYESARFSTRPISDAEFRRLMRLFAELLRCLAPEDGSSYTPSVSSGRSSHLWRPGTSGTDGGSHVLWRRAARAETPDEWAFRTAPTTPKSGADGGSVYRLARSRRSYPRSRTPSSSGGGSLRSGASGSVLRFEDGRA